MGGFTYLHRTAAATRWRRPGRQERSPTVIARRLLTFAIVVTSAAAAGWWNDEWQYRKQITLDTSPAGLALSRPVSEAPILVRLHLGNFVYFMDMSPQGSDLRFVAGDDATPLRHWVESIDTGAGIANVWVLLPELRPADDADSNAAIYMYYGNSAARSASEPAIWGADEVAVYPFNEPSGLPLDVTPFGHHAVTGDAAAGTPGTIGSAIGLDGRTGLTLSEAELLSLGGSEFTLAVWVRPGARSEIGLIASQASADGSRVEMGVDRGFAYVRHAGSELRAPLPLNENQWQHLAVTHENGALALYVNGAVAAAATVSLAPAVGPIRIGATDDAPGFVGALDQLQIARVARDADRILMTAVSQAPDTTLIDLGEDEVRDNAQSAFSLFWNMLDAVRAEGWLIIVVIAVLGFVSFDVLVSKTLQLRKSEALDAAFLGRFESDVAKAHGDLMAIAPGEEPAPMARLLDALHSALRPLAAPGQPPTPAMIEVARASLDAAIVQLVDELNARLVAVTMAISGGPFLGLLGTVVGVMITFATIAAAGDVNVRTIAPGVAAALITTVMGLAIAIPSLFGYNFVAQRVGKRTAALEVFADQLLSRAAVATSAGESASGEKHAA